MNDQQERSMDPLAPVIEIVEYDTEHDLQLLPLPSEFLQQTEEEGYANASHTGPRPVYAASNAASGQDGQAMGLPMMPCFPSGQQGSAEATRSSMRVVDGSSRWERVQRSEGSVHPQCGTASTFSLSINQTNQLQHQQQLVATTVWSSQPRQAVGPPCILDSGLTQPEMPPPLLMVDMTAPESPSQSEAGRFRASEDFPFPDLTVFHDLVSNNQVLRPEIHATVLGQGWGRDDNNAARIMEWHCYRRNYFAVACSYELQPYPNGPVYIRRDGGYQQVQSLALYLTATVDGPGGKSVDLVQLTPKRDQGPTYEVQVPKLMPRVPAEHSHGIPAYSMYQGQLYPAQNGFGPYLPLQAEPEELSEAMAAVNRTEPTTSSYYQPHASGALPGLNTSLMFQRLQFRRATANNGRRGANQQYFTLIVQLFADVRHPNSSRPEWVKVAQRSSESLVCRGRSPSHYGETNAKTRGRNNGNGGGKGPSKASGTGKTGMPLRGPGPNRTPKGTYATHRGNTPYGTNTSHTARNLRQSAPRARPAASRKRGAQAVMPQVTSTSGSPESLATGYSSSPGLNYPSIPQMYSLHQPLSMAQSGNMLNLNAQCWPLSHDFDSGHHGVKHQDPNTVLDYGNPPEGYANMRQMELFQPTTFGG